MNIQFRTSAFILLATAAVLGRAQAQAQELDWIGSTGNWFVPSNWYNQGTGPNTLPTAADLAVVGSVTSGTCTINQPGATCYSLDVVAFDNDGYNMPNAVQMTAGQLSAAQYEIIYPGTNYSVGFAGFTQSGGINSVGNAFYLGFTDAYGQSGDGVYILSGSGMLSAPTEYLGYPAYNGFPAVAGSFTQTGGTNAAGSLVVAYGGSGSYTLSGNGLLSTITTGSITVGNSGSGYFTQSGGVNNTGNLYLAEYPGSSGAYMLSGTGVLNVASFEEIGVSGPASFAQSGGTHNVASFSVGFNYGSSGSYSLSGPGVLTATSVEQVGCLAPGAFTQSAGSNTTPYLYVGLYSDSSGTYSLDGAGLLSTTAEYVGYGASGTFTQSAGTNNIASGGNFALILGNNAGYSGSYNLSNSGLLQATLSELIGYSGSGTFTQSGGTNNIAGGSYALILGYNAGANGAYNLSGAGLLTTPGALVVGNSGAGNFSQSGGTANIAALYLGYNPGANGSYALSRMTGMAMLNTAYYEYIGYQGRGSFNQSGGNNTAQALYIGDYASSGGTYNLSGTGLLNTAGGSEFIGYAGTGSFNQSGGTHNATYLYLGEAALSAGSYTLSNLGMMNSSFEYVGDLGAGNFAQTAGVNNAGVLTIGRYAGSSGTYALNGGTLGCSQISGGAGSSTFYFNGGLLLPSVFGGNFMSGLTAAYVQNGGALINTNGQNITIAQPLLNGGVNGSLYKLGQGALTLAAASTYPDGTFLYAGTLVAANTSGSALGSGTLLPEGGVLAAGPAGGTISGQVLSGGTPYTIAPGGALSSGYGTLNLDGGLVSNNYTKLLFNISASTSLGTGFNGANIYGGDLLNLGNSSLNITGGQIALVNTPTQTGDYRLIYDATLTGGTASLANFTLPSQSGISYTLSTAVDSAGYIDLVVGVGNMGASGGTWTHSGSGSWATGSDWSGGLFPSSGTVTLGSPGGPIMITLDGYRTAGALVFNGASGYTLAQGSSGALTLGTTAGGSIAVNDGSHTISAPLQMAGNLTVGVAGGAALQLSGVVSESATGTSFTLNGPGTLNYSATGTFTGSSIVNGGTLNLTGGYLPGGPSEFVNSTVVQSGGNNVVSPAGYYNALYLDHGATYTMSGGQLSAPSEWVSYDASAAFVQTGGTNTAANYLFLGAYANATYTLSGGLLSVATEEVGALGTPYSSTITQTGGTDLVSTMYLGDGSPGNFYLTPGTSGGGGLLSAQTEYLGISNGSGYFSQSAGTNSASFLYAGYSNGAGEYVLSGSGMLSAAYEYFGYNSVYTSTMYQSGGTNMVAFFLSLGNNLGDSGAYNLSGGSLAVAALNGAEYIGYDGTGVFTQTGGTHTIGVPLYLAYNADGNGAYNLGAGSLFAASEYVGYSGSATFTQTGGTHTVGTASPNFPFLFLGYNAGSSGTYNLGGGSLWCGGQEYIGDAGNGTFSQSGGYHTAAEMVLGSNPGSSGSYSLTLGNISCQTAEFIGGGGNGSFSQGGGINAPGWVILGSENGGSGTYQLDGGQLSALYETVGNSGTGAFQQAGGSNVISTYALYMAAAAGSSGSYALSGGGYLSAPTEYIGNGGNAVFTQTGGSNAVGSLILAEEPGLGTYNLGDGVLSLSALYQGSGTPIFNFSGGTFQATTTFTTYLPINLSQAGSNGVFDTNGNTLTLNGALTGPGGLQKIGTGSLTLTGTNTYGGGTFVEGGELVLTNNEALLDGSNVAVGDPMLLTLFGGVEPADRSSAEGNPTEAGTTSAVPEPSALALLAGGLVFLALRWKRNL